MEHPSRRFNPPPIWQVICGRLQHTWSHDQGILIQTLHKPLSIPFFEAHLSPTHFLLLKLKHTHTDTHTRAHTHREIMMHAKQSETLNTETSPYTVIILSPREKPEKKKWNAKKSLEFCQAFHGFLLCLLLDKAKTTVVCSLPINNSRCFVDPKFQEWLKAPGKDNYLTNKS